MCGADFRTYVQNALYDHRKASKARFSPKRYCGVNNSPFPPGALLRSYLRDSGGNKQDLSVFQQRAVVEGWCEQSGYVLTHIYADAARPGGSVVGRDEFAKMIEYFSKPGQPEAGVIFWDYSRFARNFDDGQFFISLLRRNGYQVHSLEQQIPPGSMGKVVESLHLWAADEYKAELGRNIQRGIHKLIQAFKIYPNSNVPPGYRKYPIEISRRRDGTPHIGNRLEPDPLAAPRVRRAFELRAAGRSFSEVHAVVDIHRFRQNYQLMFLNEIYLGVLVYGAARYEDFCEPLVDRDTWDKVQEVSRQWRGWRQNPGTAYHPRRARSSFLLSGLVRCRLCGYMMAAHHYQTRGHTYRYYYDGWNESGIGARCPTLKVREDELNNRVVSRLLEYLSGDEYLQAIVAALRLELDRQPDTPSPVVSLRAKLSQIEAGKARIIAAIVAAGHSDALLNELASLESQEAEARQKLARAEAEDRQRAASLAGLDPAAAQRLALEARTGLEAPDFRSRQLTLRELIKEIRVAQEKGRPLQGEMTIRLPGTEIERTVDL